MCDYCIPKAMPFGSVWIGSSALILAFAWEFLNKEGMEGWLVCMWWGVFPVSHCVCAMLSRVCRNLSFCSVGWWRVLDPSWVGELLWELPVCDRCFWPPGLSFPQLWTLNSRNTRSERGGVTLPIIEDLQTMCQSYIVVIVLKVWRFTNPSRAWNLSVEWPY